MSRFKMLTLGLAWGLLLGALSGCGGSNVTESDDPDLTRNSDVVLFPDMEFPEIPGEDLAAELGLDVTVQDLESDVAQDAAVDQSAPDLCNPNPCDQPPLPQCNDDGTALLVYQSPGNCTQQGAETLCQYEIKQFDCAADDKVCIDAECVFADTPCSPNPCYEAPDSYCAEDGLTLVEYVEPGDCEIVGEEGLCEYQTAELDCSADDKVCWNGACFDTAELCDPNPCQEPPLDECLEDGLTLKTFEVPGVCTVVDLQPQCEYPELLVDCEPDGLQCINDVCGIEGQGNTPTELGQVIITEFMARSQSGSDLGEWVELYNASQQFLDLDGCIMMDDGSDSHVIESVLVFEPGDYVVLGRSDLPEDNHGLEPDYVYGGYNLSNDSDEIVLKCGELEIDRVDYADVFVEMGIAAQLDPANFDVDANDVWDAWCLASEEYGDGGKLGTPGWPNIECVVDPCLDNPCLFPPEAECDDDVTLITYEPLGLCAVVEDQVECTYIEVPVSCQDDDKICQEAACVDGPTDPCEINPCVEAPAAVCDEDGLNLLQYPAVGVCTVEQEEAACDYPVEIVECWAQGHICVDGECVPEGQGNTPTEVGQIVVTEFMAKSEGGNSDDGEWVEVYNTTEAILDLQGCLLKDLDNDSHVIDQPLTIGPGMFLVLGRSDDLLENHGLEPDYVYAGFTLSNTADEIVVQCAELVIDQAIYTSDAVVTGAAYQLDPDAFDATLNDLPANWCPALTDYGTDGLLGTPGTANSDCPEVSVCTDFPCTTPEAPVCDEDGVTLHTFEVPGACEVVEELPVCSYLPKDVNCADDAKTCLGGACVEEGAALPPTAAGQVLVTEFMARSQSGSSDKGEWLELYNAGDAEVDLNGCLLLDDGTNSFEFTQSLVMTAGQYLVLGKSDVPEENHGAPVDFVHTGYTLSNGDDEIVLKCGEMEIDRVNYVDNWVDLGVAIQLDPDAFDHQANDDLANWCLAQPVYGTADKKGTPGQPNPQCPEPLPAPWCRLQWPLELTTTEGAFHDVFGRVFVAGVTDLTDGVDLNELVIGELGWGPEGSEPVDNVDWQWVATLPTPDWSGENAGEGPNDEYAGVLTAPAVGTYDYGFRFSSDGGENWVYCDGNNGFEHDGSEDGYQVGLSGILMVE